MVLSVATNIPESPSRPSLELSGEKLRLAVDALVHACEEIGGIERFTAAVQLK